MLNTVSINVYCSLPEEQLLDSLSGYAFYSWCIWLGFGHKIQILISVLPQGHWVTLRKSLLDPSLELSHPQMRLQIKSNCVS